MELAATYYDGRQARPHPVQIGIVAGQLRVTGDDIERCHALNELTIPPPLGNTPRLILFADGARCEVRDLAGFAALLPDAASSRLAIMESSWPLALASLLLLGGLLVFAYWRGLPFFAEQLARQIPGDLLTPVDQHFFDSLDGKLLHASALPEQRRQAISIAVQHLALPGDVSAQPRRMEFRASKVLGANAFALPGGTVLVLDDLVTLAENDQEIVAVLAHEMGHIAAKHALRQALQASVLGLAVGWYLGDYSSLLTGLSSTLLETRYSRDFETAADDFAIAVLRGNGIEPSRLADMLKKLAQSHAEQGAVHGQTTENQRFHGFDYLSTHPDTEARIKRILGQ